MHAVVCPACHAKIRFGREQCLRCGASLRTDRLMSNQAQADTETPRKTKLAVIGGVVAGVALLAVALPKLTDDAVAPPVLVESAGAPSSGPGADGESAATGQTSPAPSPASAQPEPGLSRTSFAPPSLAREGKELYDRGNLDLALERYREAVAKEPRDKEALNNLGQVLVRMGRAGEALEYFERAVALDDKRWAFRFNFGRALGEAGQWDRAVTEYRQAAALQPDDYATRFNLGRALHNAGDEREAIEEYKKAISLRPNDATFHLALGISYEKLQQTAGAVQAYERFLQLAPGAPDAEAVRARAKRLKQPTDGVVATAAPPR